MPSRRPDEPMRFPIAVDSPPGTIIPASPSRSPTSRTSTGSTPRLRRIPACSRKSPCRASTPTLGVAVSLSWPLPATGREPLSLREVAHLFADHRLSEALARLRDGLRVLEMGGGLHDRLGPGRRVVALEDAAPDEDPVGPELHHQRRVRRRGDATRREENHRQLPVLGDPAHQVVGRAEVLRLGHELLRAKRRKAPNAPDYGAHVSHGLDDVTGPGLSLGPDHGGTLADAPERLPEVRRPAHERHGEGPLVHVVGLVGGGEDLGLVYVVDLEGLEDLGLDEVTDAGLGHHGDRDGVLYLDNLLRIAHARDAALGPYVGRHPFEGHDRDGPRLLGDPGLFRVDHVHDDPALEHLGHPALHPEGACRLPVVHHKLLPPLITRIRQPYLTTGALAGQTSQDAASLRSAAFSTLRPASPGSAFS